MALGYVTLNPARNCHFAEYKNVHNTTVSTNIALYTYAKMVQINVCDIINTDHHYELGHIIEHYIIYLVFEKIICTAI